VLDLGLELELPEPEQDAETDPRGSAASEARALLRHDTAPSGAADPGDGAETELDLRLPDMTLMPMRSSRPPPTALGVAEEAPLELARPVGAARGAKGPERSRDASPERSREGPERSRDASPERASGERASGERNRGRISGAVREVELDAGEGPSPELRGRARRPAAASGGARTFGVVVLVLLVLAGLALAALLLGLVPSNLVARARARLPASLPLPSALPAVLGGAPEGMVQVPAAELALGCVAEDPACSPDERPPELRSMPALWVDRTEVSHADYQRCVAAGRCAALTARDPLCSVAAAEARARWPVSCVDAEQAETYCRAQDKRLPTAAEWEFAARSGQSLIYPWGATEPSCARANLGGCGGEPRPVGSLPDGASGLGVLDLAGNVWEWTADGVPNRREIRGGSFLDGARTLRASNRGWADARTQIPSIGFRCVR
jgi:hypothetical protein